MLRLFVAALLVVPAISVLAADEKPALPSFKADDLKQGGYVIFFRHAKREEIPSQAKLWELDRNSSCDPGGSLNLQGESEARAIAQGLKSKNIPAGEVLASPTCRTKQMARILFGDHFQIDKTLAPDWVRESSHKDEDAAALKALLAKPLTPGTNRFLISHGKMLTPAVAGKDIPIGQTEAAVFRPDGKGGSEFLGVIKPGDWK